MSNNLTVIEPSEVAQSEPFSAFGSEKHFVSAQRMAKALSTSSIVPETYRGEGKIGDCIIALEIANRIGATVLAVMQNLYIVHGRPAWSSQFLISCVNASRKFSALRYTMTGTKGADDWGCIAWATDKSGERLESPEVTIAISKAEGWYNRNGSKWKTMPELMLRYRAATFFTRLYAPEITMGIKTEEEVIDVETTVAVSPAPTLDATKLFASPRLAEPEIKQAVREVCGDIQARATAEAKLEAAEAPKGQPETARQYVTRMITEAQVPFDDLRDYIRVKNLARDVDSFADISQFPDALFEALAQVKTLAAIIKTYGKK